MPTYKVKIREYTYTQFEDKEPDRDLVQVLTRIVEARNVSEALANAQLIVNEFNAKTSVDEYAEDPKWGIPPYKSWTEFSFELEVPISPTHLT